MELVVEMNRTSFYSKIVADMTLKTRRREISLNRQRNFTTTKNKGGHRRSRRVSTSRSTGTTRHVTHPVTSHKRRMEDVIVTNYKQNIFVVIICTTIM
jgi:hypothetical protein